GGGLERRYLSQWQAADYNAAGMGADVAREAGDLAGALEEQLETVFQPGMGAELRITGKGFIQFARIDKAREIVREPFQGIRGNEKRFTDIPNRPLGPVGGESADHGHVLLAVLLHYVAEHIIPPLRGEVHVDIGRFSLCEEAGEGEMALD